MDPNSNMERRSCPRRAIDHSSALEVRLPGMGVRSARCDAAITDVSASGMKFEVTVLSEDVRKALTIGTNVAVRLRVRHKQARIPARVAWVHAPEGSAVTGGLKLGLALLDHATRSLFLNWAQP